MRRAHLLSGSAFLAKIALADAPCARRFAPEKIPYGIERYTKEVERVAGVLESVLSKQEWLVSNKLTIADLSFITWVRRSFLSPPAPAQRPDSPDPTQNNFGLYALLPEGVNAEEKFPALMAWHKKLLALPYVAEALKDREEAMKAK